MKSLKRPLPTIILGALIGGLPHHEFMLGRRVYYLQCRRRCCLRNPTQRYETCEVD